MKIGIIGLKGVGKTTLFNALTKCSAPQMQNRSNQPNIAVVKVPDERIDLLAKIYNPRKISYANVEFIDVAGTFEKNSSNTTYLTNIKACDILCHVVRVFDENCETFLEPINITRDIKKLNDELILSDLSIIENRLSRMKLKKKSNENEIEEKLLEKFKEALESEVMLYNLDITKDEENLILGYKFLTLKKQIIILNIDEKYLKIDINEKFKEDINYIKKINSHYLPISAKLEMEIAELEGEDEKLFLIENGLNEPGRNKLIRLSYDILGNISFFTVGEDEVKAWTIKKNDNAYEAAGKIHSDIQRGFIKAEVVSYNDFIEYKSIEKAKANGKLRLETKSYVVSDGDIINFRFNV